MQSINHGFSIAVPLSFVRSHVLFFFDLVCLSFVASYIVEDHLLFRMLKYDSIEYNTIISTTFEAAEFVVRSTIIIQ